MYNGRAKLRDGRTLIKRGTINELFDWVSDLIALYGCLRVTITEVPG